jgi:preprotein translocase subunit SecF
MISKKINFSRYFKIANLISLSLIIVSLLLLLFKGLNYGVDFKGGTLLEIRIEQASIEIQDVRIKI